LDIIVSPILNHAVKERLADRQRFFRCVFAHNSLPVIP
jgi:hypothetical protein